MTVQRRALFLLAPTILLLTSCASSAAPAPEQAPPAPPAPSTVSVSYVLKGNSGGSVTMQTPSGTSQRSVKFTGDGVFNDPVTFDFEFPRGEFLYVSIQNDSDRGVVGCEIHVNDQLMAANLANTPYGIASCER